MGTLVIMVAAIVVVLILATRWRGYQRRRVAAINLVLAKATYIALPKEMQVRVHDTAVRQLTEQLRGQFWGFGGEYIQFGCYAHAMAHLEISPSIHDYCYPRWYMVPNPFTAIRPSDPLIDKIADEIKKRHGVSISISKKADLFADITERDHSST